MAQAETTLINFTVTQAGLADQLLSLVVDRERPDLEASKTHLIVQNTEYTIKLKVCTRKQHAAVTICI